MRAPVIVVFHEARQGALEFPRATVLLELDDVLHRPVVAFDLSLRAWGERAAPAYAPDRAWVQVVGQLLRDVAWAIITKQPGPMDDPHTVHPGLGPGQVERLGHVRRLHRRPKRPRQDVARVIVEHGRQVVPAPPDHLQVGEVGFGIDVERAVVSSTNQCETDRCLPGRSRDARVPRNHLSLAVRPGQGGVAQRAHRVSAFWAYPSSPAWAQRSRGLHQRYGPHRGSTG